MGRHEAAEKSLQDQRNILPIGQLVVVFSGLAVSLLICFIDQNGLSVALPTISKDLNAEDTISWAGTSSLIANAVCTVLYGRLSDIFGRKSVYISVLVLLSISDLLCGLAVDPPMLYVFRAMAGIATGGITNMTMIIVSDVVTLQDRGKYQGILGSCVGLGNVIGPFIAAAFVENASWRDIFYLLCPCAAVSAVVAWFLLPSKMRPESMKSQVKKIDFMGTITSTIAIVFILIPISGGGLYFQWDSALVISMLTIGSVSFVLFLLIQWKVAYLPMMPREYILSTTCFFFFLSSLVSIS
jgi:MFS family permease